MNRSVELLRRCAIAMPLVRTQSQRLAAHSRLQSPDRDDLEQQFWLELLIRWNRSGSRRNRLPAFVLRRRLKRQIAEVAASIVRSPSLWRHLRPTCPSIARFALEYATDARLRHDPLRLHDLRSDVATIVWQLPEHLRERCHRLMSTTPAPGPPHCANGCPPDADLAALRDAFKASDLHEYL